MLAIDPVLKTDHSNRPDKIVLNYFKKSAPLSLELGISLDFHGRVVLGVFLKTGLLLLLFRRQLTQPNSKNIATEAKWTTARLRVENLLEISWMTSKPQRVDSFILLAEMLSFCWC